MENNKAAKKMLANIDEEIKIQDEEVKNQKETTKGRKKLKTAQGLVDSDEEEDENIEDMTDFQKQLKATQVMIEIQRREDFCICQSLSALVLSLSVKLELVWGAKDSEKFFKQLEKVGYLFCCESLVSTPGLETV